MAPLSHLLAAAAAGAAALIPVRAQPHLVTLSGACDAKKDLNGVSFTLQGNTLSGAPYWKALHKEEYIFWDPDCDGSGDGTPRWIIDSQAPNISASRDLDGDGQCQYHARINSEDKTGPPHSGQWSMECDGAWSQYFVVLTEVTTTTPLATTTTVPPTTATLTATVTSTSTLPPTTTTLPPTTTTLPPTTTTLPPTTTTLPPHTTIVAANVTNSSAHPTDPHDGTDYTDGDHEPNTTEHPHTDGDHEANTTEHPHTDGDHEASTTPDSHTDGDHGATGEHGHDGGHGATTTPHAAHAEPTGSPAMLALSGACAYKSSLNGMTFEYAGRTADGAPFYKAHGVNEYLYHDGDCDGSGSVEAARWVLDSDAPSSSRMSDLDGDSKCDYHARLDSSYAGTDKPPSMATWRMYCGEQGWMDITVSFREVDEVQPTFAPSKANATTPGDSAAGGGMGGSDDGMVSGAPGGYRGLAALVVLPLLRIMEN